MEEDKQEYQEGRGWIGMEGWRERGVLYFLCRSLLFFRARKMGLCNESCDRARNSGGATAAFALPSRSRAFLAASTRTRSSSPKKPNRHSETRPERGLLRSQIWGEELSRADAQSAREKERLRERDLVGSRKEQERKEERETHTHSDQCATLQRSLRPGKQNAGDFKAHTLVHMPIYTHLRKQGTECI